MSFVLCRNRHTISWTLLGDGTLIHMAKCTFVKWLQNLAFKAALLQDKKRISDKDTRISDKGIFRFLLELKKQAMKCHKNYIGCSLYSVHLLQKSGFFCFLLWLYSKTHRENLGSLQWGVISIMSKFLLPRLTRVKAWGFLAHTWSKSVLFLIFLKL